MPDIWISVPSACHAAVPKSISVPSGIGFLWVAVLFDIISNFHRPTIVRPESRSETRKKAPASVLDPTPGVGAALSAADHLAEAQPAWLAPDKPSAATPVIRSAATVVRGFPAEFVLMVLTSISWWQGPARCRGHRRTIGAICLALSEGDVRVS